jgi:hypothetical protein
MVARAKALEEHVAGTSEFQHIIIRKIDVTARFMQSVNKFICIADSVAATGHECVLRMRITANRTLSELD